MDLCFDMKPAPPEIITFPQETSFHPKDAPNEVRWRASWFDHGYLDGAHMSIAIQAYPVDSVTPCGAWVRPNGFWHGNEWEPKQAWETLRWVSNTGGAAWAKPTREEALYSLSIRLTRWTERLARDVGRAMAATQALRMLRPEDAVAADRAEHNLRSMGVA